uniref:Uncharacterized protein n=1 Tax=Triticum urartu TaxID=4572 RepID=A0A8R7Q0W1_TRIUA
RVRSDGEEALDGGPEGARHGGPGGLRRVHVVPVEVAAGVVAERVLPRALLVLLAAVAVGPEALAARPQRALEQLVVTVIIVVVEEEGGEGGVEVEEEEGAVVGVEGAEDRSERGVVLGGPGVGQRVAAGVVERAGEYRRAPHGVQVDHHHPPHPRLVA